MAASWLTDAQKAALKATADAMSAPGKGFLASDESAGPWLRAGHVDAKKVPPHTPASKPRRPPLSRPLPAPSVLHTAVLRRLADSGHGREQGCLPLDAVQDAGPLDVHLGRDPALGDPLPERRRRQEDGRPHHRQRHDSRHQARQGLRQERVCRAPQSRTLYPSNPARCAAAAPPRRRATAPPAEPPASLAPIARSHRLCSRPAASLCTLHPRRHRSRPSAAPATAAATATAAASHPRSPSPRSPPDCRRPPSQLPPPPPPSPPPPSPPPSLTVAAGSPAPPSALSATQRRGTRASTTWTSAAPRRMRRLAGLVTPLPEPCTLGRRLAHASHSRDALAPHTLWSLCPCPTTHHCVCR